MSIESDEEPSMLPHHKQQALCTTRLPYRQGRKLTAVKVYTVNNESNHLLVFGVPSLNLRQETKTLFLKFGKLLQFSITESYPKEIFTENYHAVYEKISSARIAKRMLDTNNFYGGSLHVCYAPELETIEETKKKLFQRQRDIMYQLKNLQKTKEESNVTVESYEVNTTPINNKLNMGEVNLITIGNESRSVNNNKRKNTKPVVIEKKFKPCLVSKDAKSTDNNVKIIKNISNNEEIDIIDFTSTETETITNVNESFSYKNESFIHVNENLNYNKFGNEIIRKIPEKPVNRIKFNVGNKKV